MGQAPKRALRILAAAGDVPGRGLKQWEATGGQNQEWVAAAGDVPGRGLKPGVGVTARLPPHEQRPGTSPAEG